MAGIIRGRGPRGDGKIVKRTDSPKAPQTSTGAVMEVNRNGDEILTSREARLLLKIGRTKLWELTRSGKIPAYRVGDGNTSDLRYKRSELLKWLEAHAVTGSVE